MAIFQGSVVPATLQRLRRFFSTNPTIYNKYVPGTGMEEALTKADDIMDDGIVNASGADLHTEVKFVPFTSVDGSLDNDELSLGASDVGTITPSFLPVNATNAGSVVYTYSSDDEDVATVADGVITPVAEGLCVITLGIAGTSLTKDFDVEVVA